MIHHMTFREGDMIHHMTFPEGDMILNYEYFLVHNFVVGICKLRKSKTRFQSLYDVIVSGFHLRAHDSAEKSSLPALVQRDLRGKRIDQRLWVKENFSRPARRLEARKMSIITNDKLHDILLYLGRCLLFLFYTWTVFDNLVPQVKWREDSGYEIAGYDCV